MGRAKGFLSVVLHAHLPYVKHPEHEDSLEERWLFQALTECYIPLLEVLTGLLRDGVPFRASVSLSPPLLEMLSDPLLQERYEKHLCVLVELAEKEIGRTAGDDRMQGLARMYRDRFAEVHRLYTDVFHRDPVRTWAGLGRSGRVDLMASAATHGYLPLLLSPKAVAAQVRAGLAAFRKHFSSHPSGFWLPECAYVPELEPALRRDHITYFVLETHGVLLASPRPRFGFHAPLVTPHGMLAFGRDPECSKQVWSADEGYPGDPVYREFYRDAGYDLPAEYLGRAIPGHRAPTGLKYHRVTDRRSQAKDLYEPARAAAKAREHAANFLFWRNKEAEYYGSVLGRAPVMVAPYDAELFGHWWYEGPVFLDELFRLAAKGEAGVTAIAPPDYLERYPVNQVARPASSSWGYRGYNEVWLDGSNDWIYRHLHHAQDEMAKVVERHKGASGLALRALNQAAREIMLAQASDWPFIMKAGNMAGYARHRFTSHLGRFHRLIEQLRSGGVDPVFLRDLEERDGIFRDMEPARCWAEAEDARVS